ncbi:MAG: hypothetical protein IPK82_37595 [Polyangiaceae bacterium]|nr:hypothetical protein [Polyangiaceae bacterium]
MTTLITGGIASNGFGVVFAPVGGIPLVGGYAMSGFGAAVRAGPGTIAALIALSTTQIIGFSIMLKGIVSRKPAALVPTCEEPILSFSPMVVPGVAGVTMGGAL